MDALVISDDPNHALVFARRKLDANGWLESYEVSGESDGLRVTREVWNPPYGDSPYRLFEQMAESWRGWSGEKGWGSMEGEMNLGATCSKTGHVLLSVELVGSSGSWSSVVKIELEAGQLERLARQAKKFFNC